VTASDSAASAGLLTTGLLDALTTIAVEATQAIRRLGGTGGVRTKTDGSPVTAADETAEAVIRDGLMRHYPEFPIVSEEETAPRRPVPRGAIYFLVDPLDGTREFIAGSKEYTVNIALVADTVPVLGIITAPALGLIWRGIVGSGTDRLQLAADGKVSSPATIRTRPRPADDLTVMVSRSNLEARTRAYLDDIKPAQTLACGSSLKFCRLAEGAADLYPRLAPTHDWDIGAGHAILTAAGGSVTAPDGGPLVYGTPALLIPAFIARGAPTAGRQP
jgi:3'(2'), 5'-bisphosphate nucleotidase